MSVTHDIVAPVSFVFLDDGLVPNNPLPLLVYKSLIAVDNSHPEMAIEGLFGANGWGKMWRNGIYGYPHYHPTVHEALAIARVRKRALWRRPRRNLRTTQGRCRDPAGRYRTLMSVRKPGFRSRGRLSAGAEHGDCPPDAGQSWQGT